MKSRIMVFAVLAMIAAPLHAQIKVSERDSILKMGPLLRDICDRSQDPIVNQLAQKCFWEYTNDSTKHAMKYERALYEQQKAKKEAAKAQAPTIRMNPVGVYAQAPQDTSPKITVTKTMSKATDTSGLQSAGTDLSSDAIARFTGDTTKRDSTSSPKGGWFPIYANPDSIAARDSIRAKQRRDSIVAARRDSMIKARSVGRERQKNTVGDAGAQRIADVKVVSGPKHQAFCKGAQTNLTYAAGLRANDPDVINGDCKAHVRAWLHAHPWLSSRVKTCDDLAEYIEGLEAHPLPLGYSVTTYWVDGPNFGTFDREVKLSAPGVGEVGLFDAVRQEFVGFMGCCNALQGKLIPIGTARPFGSQGMGPGADNDRLGRGGKGHRGNPNDLGIHERKGLSTGTVLTVLGIAIGGAGLSCWLDDNHWCIGKNKNTNENNNENNNTVRAYKAPGVNVPLATVLKILR